MNNKLKGMIAGALVGIVGCIIYALLNSSQIPFYEFNPGLTLFGQFLIVFMLSIIGFMVGSGIKESK
jgi:hypothetical protein